MHPRLTVLGAGNLGVSHAACMAKLGFDVLAVDTGGARISALSAGDLPFFEPGLECVLRRGLDYGRLRFTGSYPEAASFGVAQRKIVDGRHVLDSDIWRGAGWDYRAPGRPSHSAEGPLQAQSTRHR